MSGGEQRQGQGCPLYRPSNNTPLRRIKESRRGCLIVQVGQWMLQIASLHCTNLLQTREAQPFARLTKSDYSSAADYRHHSQHCRGQSGRPRPTYTALPTHLAARLNHTARRRRANTLQSPLSPHGPLPVAMNVCICPASGLQMPNYCRRLSSGPLASA